MHADKPSSTAQTVALWRTLADGGATTIPDFSDPFARAFVVGPVARRWLGFVEAKVAKAKRPPQRLMEAIDSVLLRVVFIDAELAAAEPRQVVNLGAGFDTRAWRLPALREVPLFEVDHPATQAIKREHARELPPPLASMHYVPVDFTRDDLASALGGAGFDASVPTLFIWEGVTMYLDDTALRSTLTALRRLAAPGSTLLVHYHEPSQGFSVPMQLFRWLVLRFMREPQIGLRTREVMRAELARAGFSVRQDAGADEQAARVGVQVAESSHKLASRVLVAAG